MPELPEVESFRIALSSEYVGKLIKTVHFRRANIRYPLSNKIMDVLCRGSELLAIQRDGKQLVFVTGYGKVYVSLGMTGSFLPSAINAPHKHEHVSIEFTDSTVLGYIDPRRFGFWLVPDSPLKHLADPLDEMQLIDLFSSQKIKSSTRSIKEVLMDQKLIGGIGNIYALEALHLSGVKPTRQSNALTKKEYTSLAKTIPGVLNKAIDMGGSTISTYRRLNGEGGNFQELHRVYGREDEQCLNPDCTGKIKRILQSGRSSWYCPKCQK